jgi:tetratricopeptide (TPR) repeat protein
MSAAGTKECPFCAEMIKAAAVLCRFCGRELPAPPATPARCSDDPAGGQVPASVASPGLAQNEVFDLLAVLVEKSLAWYEQDEQGRGRYRLLETVRQYARDRLVEHGEGAALRDRHRDWFLLQTEQLQNRAWTEQEPYFDFTEAEHDNLRQALVWSLHGGQDGAEGLRLAGALWLAWFQAGALTEGRSRLEEALAEAPDAPPAVRAHALTGLGMILFTNDPLARRSLEESVALCRETGERPHLVAALNALGHLYARDGDVVGGIALLDEARALSSELGEQFVVYCDFYCGLTAQWVGDHSEAEWLLDRVVAHPRTWKSVRHFALAALGEVQLELNRVALARSNFREALVLAEPMHSMLTILKCLCGLARVWLAEGDAARSARLLGAVAAWVERLHMPQLPGEAGPVERTAAAARAILSETGFESAFAEGKALALDQAIEQALEPAEGVA